MARTTTAETFNPDMLTDAVQGEIARKNVFFGSVFAQSGTVVVSPTLGKQGEQMEPGTQVTIPYFGTIGPFERNLADGAALTPRRIRMTTESNVVQRDGLAFEATRWAQFASYADPYKECARQIGIEMTRDMDLTLIEAAVSAGVYEIDYGTDNISWDALVDAKASAFGDEDDAVTVMVCHSQAKRDLMLLKDSDGRPLMVDSMKEGDFPRIAGIPIVTSDRVPLTGSAMGAVTEAGTTPPDVTLAGTPLGPWDLRIEIVTGGASNGSAATFRFSVNGGAVWSETYPVPAGGGAFVLDESPIATSEQADSLVGFNGATGITATFTNGTYAADNVYTAQADLRPRTLLMKARSLAYWYNRDEAVMLTDKDILRHTDLAAMHLYHVGHRYRRREGSTRSGIVSLKFQSSKYDGTLEA